jgi:hypothetical protein
MTKVLRTVVVATFITAHILYQDPKVMGIQTYIYGKWNLKVKVPRTNTKGKKTHVKSNL